MSDKASFDLFKPPWLQLLRGLWVALCLAAVLIFVVGAATQLNAPLPSCITDAGECSLWAVYREDAALAPAAGVSTWFVFWAATLGQWLPRLIWFAVGMVLFWRRSADGMAWLVSLTLVLFVFEGVHIPGTLAQPAALLYGLAVFLFFLLPFVFPNGRFVPGWMGWIAIPLNLFISVGSLLPRSEEGDPIGLWLGLGGSILWMLLAIYAVVYRYRKASPGQERQQIKWLMAGVIGWSIALIPPLLSLAYFPADQPTPQRLLFLLLVNFPVYILAYLITATCVGMAIFRYRLWDIDILIRRTLQYSLLTALLALVYFGSVVLLQTLFGSFTGEQSPAVIVISTLLIAALFTPLRRRVQNVIDRRFYRKKYDAAQVLAQFARTARDETDLDSLTAALSRVVDETIQPEGVAIWLKW